MVVAIMLETVTRNWLSTTDAVAAAPQFPMWHTGILLVCEQTEQEKSLFDKSQVEGVLLHIKIGILPVSTLLLSSLIHVYHSPAQRHASQV